MWPLLNIAFVSPARISLQTCWPIWVGSLHPCFKIHILGPLVAPYFRATRRDEQSLPPHVLVKDFSKNLVAEILGIVWLNLKGGVSFVSVPFLFARIWAIWWPLCLSKRWFSKGAMDFVGPIPSAFQASRSEKEDALGGSCFNVFEAARVTFWSISESFWEVLPPFGRLPTHRAPESHKCRKLCEK